MADNWADRQTGELGRVDRPVERHDQAVDAGRPVGRDARCCRSAVNAAPVRRRTRSTVVAPTTGPMSPAITRGPAAVTARAAKMPLPATVALPFASRLPFEFPAQYA